MQLCDYGCEQEGKYQFKNGKWCCSPSYMSCKFIRKSCSNSHIGKSNHNKGKKFSEEYKKKLSEAHLGKITSSKTREKMKLASPIISSVTINESGILCDYGCGQEAKYRFKNGRRCCSKTTNSCSAIRKKSGESNNHRISPMKGKKHKEETKEKIGKSNQNNIPWNKGKSGIYSEECLKRMKDLRAKTGFNYTEETKRKMSESRKYKSEDYLKHYSFLFKVEEYRIVDEKIEMKCKNSECQKWFNPSQYEMYCRNWSLEHEIHNSAIYCSKECKSSCSLHRYRIDRDHTSLVEDGKEPYTGEYIKIWSQEVLSRDNHTCQYCGSTENLHAHHIKPKKLFPYEALDPDNGITLCKECHYKIGHKGECSTYTLSIRKCS